MDLGEVFDASVPPDALIDDGDVGRRARAVLSEDTHWVAPRRFSQ